MDTQRIVSRLSGRTQRQLEGRVATVVADNGDGTVDVDLAGSTLTVPVITAVGSVGEAMILVTWDGNLFGLAAESASSAFVPLLVAGDPDTKVDQTAGADTLSVIAGGVEIARFSEGTNDQFLVGPAGTTTVPNIALIADPNTGVSLQGSDALGLLTAGVQRLQIDSSGRVGIGAASNGSQLLISRSGNPPSNGVDDIALVLSGNFGGGIGFIDGTGNFAIWVDTTGTISRFGFGSSLGALTSMAALKSGGGLTLGSPTGGGPFLRGGR